MEIDGKAVDPRVLDYFKSSIQVLDANKLRELALPIRDVLKGFRANKVDEKILRLRLQQLVNFKECKKPFIELLRGATFQRNFLVVLNAEAISAGLNSFAKYFGPVEFYGSMLLDDREEVRVLAFKKIESLIDEIITDSDRTIAAQNINREFKPFIELIEHISLAKTPVKPYLQKQKTAPAVLTQAQKNQLVENSPQYKKLRREKTTQIKNQDEQISKLTDQVQALTDSESKLRADSVELKKLKDSIEQTVNKRTKDYLEKRVGSWFKSSEILAAEYSTGGKLINNVLTTLERQAEIDKRFGLIKNIRQELESCKELKIRLIEARAESLRPMVQLKTHEHELQLRITELEILLSISSQVNIEASESFKKFAIALKACEAIDQIVEIRSRLKVLSTHDQWKQEEIFQAYDLISTEALRFYLQDGNKVQDKDRDRLGISSPLQAVRMAIAQSDSCTLLIDGHNVLHALKSTFGSYFENNIPGKKARKELTRRLRELVDLHQNISVDLWFDGPEEVDVTVNEKIRVRFSGGSGQDRADKKIRESLAYLESVKLIKNCIVVSEDREVLASAKEFNAIQMDPNELANLIIMIS